MSLPQGQFWCSRNGKSEFVHSSLDEPHPTPDGKLWDDSRSCTRGTCEYLELFIHKHGIAPEPGDALLLNVVESWEAECKEHPDPKTGHPWFCNEGKCRRYYHARIIKRKTLDSNTTRGQHAQNMD